MPELSDDRLRLSDYLTALCADLAMVRATESGGGLELHADASTLEVDIAYSLSSTREPEFWVDGRALGDSEDEREIGGRARQRLTVRFARHASPAPYENIAGPVKASFPTPFSPGDD